LSPVGRRPGKTDTRQEIIEAARVVFAEKGYDGTSLRAVARAAAVDPALVHHYFDGKSDLFVAAMALPFDPRQVQDRAAGTHGPDAPSSAHPAGSPGPATVEAFLTMWDRAEGTGSSFTSCVAAMASSPNVADAMREFVTERIWNNLPRREGESEAQARRRFSMISSQLMGLAFTRYLLRVPPVSTATPKEVARWGGPTLQRYAEDPLP
jgi:AcrR family transcriptional regulator